MADHIFSTARLRGYRVLEEAGLGDAVELQLLNSVIAGRLWLPFALIEIALRNAIDRALCENHPAGTSWLLDAGLSEDGLVALDVTGKTCFRGRRSDGTTDDPVAEAARMAGLQLGRDVISRDDLIAHLMMGFWVHRCPGALHRDPGINVWQLVSDGYAAPLDSPEHFKSVMSRLLLMRNRVAHHEALLFRAKHVFKRDGDPKVGADLVTSLQGAFPTFLNDVELAITTASTLADAPDVTRSLEVVSPTIRADVAPLEATLERERQRLRELRDARLAASRAEHERRRAAERDQT